MKHIFNFLLLSTISIIVNGQEIKTARESNQIIETRSIYLNSGSRATFGGKSRTFIKIDLPENTVEWYYSFSTSTGQSGFKNLNLAVQLSSLLADPTGLTATALSSVKVPSGSSSIDVFLCNRANIDKFMDKADSWGGTYTYIIEGTVNNTKQAVVKVDDVISGTWYIGIKNPSSLDGVNITIEVVAIVETQIIIEKSEEQKKAELYGGLGWKKFENGEYQKCIEYCNKANGYFELGWVNANKGLSQLMLGKESEAMDTYIIAITLIKKQNNPDYIFSGVIKDLENVLKTNPDLSGASDIKELIEMERK